MTDVLGRTVLEIEVPMQGLDAGLAQAESRTKGFGQRAKTAVGAAMGAALGGVASAALGASTAVDDAFDSIRVGTGATGEALKALEGDFKSVAGNVPDDIGLVGQVLADLNTRTGQTGEGLQNLTEQILDMSRITKTDATQNVALATRAFGDWGVAVEDQADTLDMFFRASQQTGIGVDKLMESVVQFGAPLRNIGFSLEESAAMMGKWEKEGVNTTLALGGLKIALGEFAKEGVDAKEGLADLIDQITNAETSAEAMALGVQKFGSRAGPDMVAAIREGRFAFDDYTESIANGTETIADATNETEDFADKLKGFFNTATIAIGEMAMPLAGLSTAIPGLARMLPMLGGAVGGLAGHFSGAGKAGTGLARVAPIIGASFHAMLGPIGLVTGAIALLAAGFATDFLGMRTRLERDVNDMAMNFGDMGDTVHALADRTGTDFQSMKDRISAEMAETGDSFEQVVFRIANGYTKMTEAQAAAVEASGNAWADHRTMISDAMYGANEEVAEGVAAASEELGSLPEKGADELLANQFHLTDAATQLVNFMDQALSPMEEKAQARAFLASDALGNALGSPNPLVRQKAAELQQQALDVLNNTSGFYSGGEASGMAWAYGAGSRRVLDAAFGAGVTVAASFGMSTRGMSPPKEGPLKHIDEDAERVGMAWVNGVRRIVSEAFGVGKDLAGGLARGLVPDLSMPTLPSLAAPAMMAPAMAGVMGGAVSGAAGATIQNIYQLHVNGVERVAGDREDVLDGWDTLKRSAR